MSGWLEEIGDKKYSAKELGLVVKIFDLLKEVEEIGNEDNELMDEFIEKLDNAIYNVTELKRIITENL